MYTAIKAAVLWKFPVSTRFDYPFTRRQPEMDFMSKIIEFVSHNNVVNISNLFCSNVATDWRGRATIVAGTAGQHYIDNIFYNPDNDYEMITVNRSM